MSSKWERALASVLHKFYVPPSIRQARPAVQASSYKKRPAQGLRRLEAYHGPPARLQRQQITAMGGVHERQPNASCINEDFERQVESSASLHECFRQPAGAISTILTYGSRTESLKRASRVNITEPVY
eukprot:357008-Chlamydomonas_euryale.AAC.2